MDWDSNIKSELMNDFETLISKIDFENYRPNSPEFSNALHIGLMWKLLSELSENPEVENSKKEIEPTDDISEELKGAEHYLQKYYETSDMQYKQMASDELRHAGILIKKEEMKNPENELIPMYESKQKSIAMRLM